MRLIQGPISAEAVTKATAEALKDQPVYTLTLDNGAEFAGHQSIEAQLGAAVYFTDPHSPWQRPSNENTNGLLRFFFPKGFDFSTTTPEYVAEIEELLDTRPENASTISHPWISSPSVALDLTIFKALQRPPVLPSPRPRAFSTKGY